MDEYKITAEEVSANNVKAAADLVKGEPSENKNIFDRLPELIVERHNGLAGAVYSKEETDSVINSKITEIGAGDMAKAVYDADGDGIVDAAENGIFVYTHTAGALSGSGTNGRFKATVSETVSALNVNGTSCAVKCGEETEMELVADCWYTFILDGNTVNFSSGGAGLNFKIVGSTTEPVSPKENTIWVETDVAIGEWQFSAKEPAVRADGTALAAGDVWVEISENADVVINIAKKNGVNIGLNAVYLWDGTDWIEQTAKAYINANWTDIEGYYYLFKANAVNRLVGGWQTNNNQSGSITDPSIDADGNLSSIGANEPFANKICKTGFDITDYSTLIFTLTNAPTGTNGNSNAAVNIGLATSTGYNTVIGGFPINVKTNTSTGEFFADISAKEGTYYFGFAMCYMNAGTLSFSEIKLKK